MSWELAKVGPERAPEIFDSIDAAECSPALSADLSPGVAEAVGEQLSAAKAAAKAIVQSQAVGDPDALYFVRANGHANVGHQKTEGYVNDFVTVMVTQADAPEPGAEV